MPDELMEAVLDLQALPMEEAAETANDSGLQFGGLVTTVLSGDTC